MLCYKIYGRMGCASFEGHGGDEYLCTEYLSWGCDFYFNLRIRTDVDYHVMHTHQPSAKKCELFEGVLAVDKLTLTPELPAPAAIPAFLLLYSHYTTTTVW